MYGSLNSFTDSISLILGNKASFGESFISTFLDQNKYLLNLENMQRLLENKEIALIEWVLLCSNQKIYQLIDTNPHFSDCDLQEIKEIYKDISKILKDIFACIEDKHIKKLCLTLSKDKDDQDEMFKIEKEVKYSLVNDPIDDLELQIDNFLAKVEKFKDLMFLSSKIYKKLLFFRCLVENKNEFINYFFTEKEFEKVKEYTKAHEPGFYYATQDIYYTNTDKMPNKRSRNQLPKLLRSTNEYLFKKILKNKDKLFRQERYNKINFFFEGTSKEEEVSILKGLLQGVRDYQSKFEELFDKYQDYKKVEYLISYTSSIYDIFYTNDEDDFTDLDLYRRMKKVQDQGIISVKSSDKSRVKKIKKVILEAKPHLVRFRFIKEVSSKFRGGSF